MSENPPPNDNLVFAPPAESPSFAPPAAPPVAPLSPTATAAGFASSTSSVATSGGWAPPRRPGFIPLRPLGLGSILAGAFAILRKAPSVTLVPALLLSVAAAIVSVDWSGIRQQFGTDQVLPAVLTVVPLALGAMVSAFIDGYTAFAVSRAALGERPTTRSASLATRGYVGARIAVWGIIVFLVVLVPAIVIVLVNQSLFRDPSTAWIAVLIDVGLGLGLVVLIAWLSTKTSLVASALLIEHAPLGRAIGRSWRLTRGVDGFWKILGVRTLVWVMLVVASAILIVPIQLLLGLGGSLVFVNGGLAASDGINFASSVIESATRALMAAIGAVVTGATSALLYLDARMRREGLDLELTRYLDTPAAQRVSDPYLPRDV